ncbi:MAG TPA: tyrosine-type recombinase/integrase [Thermoleophilaceae bacterium]|nr:tyrosine-type recombinase/integrase [Thermoleophilaceae bacterium]
MSSSHATPRRRREPGDRNRNIYRRYDGSFEVGYRDSTGRQRWTRAFDTITAARAARDDLLGRKARGDRVQPNPRLRFGEAADRWLNGQVVDLRPATQAIYRNAIDNHLRPRWGRHRLDAISVDDAANLVRDLRAGGLADNSIVGIIQVANRVFKYAQRRLDWRGVNPISLMERSERPKASGAKRRIYQGDELAQTLAASRGQSRLLFTLAAVTGARLSELLGLTWADLNIENPAEATITFTHQVDRRGQRVPLKTTDSEGVVVIPRAIATTLQRHRERSAYRGPHNFAFATRTGRPLSQRNVCRALKAAQRRARTRDGDPTFPALHSEASVPRGAVPSFHSFRHTAASHALVAGDTAEEVSWMLRHKTPAVTRAIYLHEVRTAERSARTRTQVERRYQSALTRIA